MKTIKKWQLISLFIANVFAIQACSNSNAENNKVSENKVSESGDNMQEEDVSTEFVKTSKVQEELDKAKKDGKAVFVVVTGTGITNTDQATTVAKGANSIYKNAVVVQMNRDDAANSQLVAEWRLSGAPLPIILVISSKGQVTGGYVLEQATAENIAALIPSPKLEQVYDAIGTSKFAVVAFTKKTFTDRTEVLKECNKAVSMLNNEAVFIEVDMEDQKEIGFMQQLRISPLMAKSSVTLVINAQGQVAGQSTTIPSAEKLVAAAKSPVKGGCGPGCGPAGCGK